MKKLLTIVSSAAVILLTASVAMAAGDGPSEIILDKAGYFAIAIGFGMGIAAFGGALGQSKAAAAALEGISRNPNAADKVFVPMLLGLAFIESLVLFTMVIQFMLLGKF